jgi:hypothetical protein
MSLEGLAYFRCAETRAGAMFNGIEAVFAGDENIMII